MPDDEDHPERAGASAQGRGEAASDGACFERVRQLLQEAFAEPDASFVETTADDLRALAADRLR